MRVGIYCVRAGDTNIKTREQWDLQPFVVGDVIDKETGVHMDDDDKIDVRRLGEAARYTLEPLTALRFIDRNSDVAAVFLHGPLINQFVMYDRRGASLHSLFEARFFIGRRNFTNRCGGGSERHSQPCGHRKNVAAIYGHLWLHNRAGLQLKSTFYRSS